MRQSSGFAVILAEFLALSRAAPAADDAPGEPTKQLDACNQTTTAFSFPIFRQVIWCFSPRRRSIRRTPGQ
jgi:hypothetical protein